MDWNSYKKNFILEARKSDKSDIYIQNNLEYAQYLYGNDLPIIYNAEHLSLLVGVKLKYIMSVVYSQRNFYRSFQINKRNGKKRTISEPLPNLKFIQQWILTEILEKTEVSRFAKAYIKGVSLKENVKFHKNQKIVLKLDIKNFFGTLQEKEVYKYFMTLGYNNDVAMTLANLCTLNRSLPQGACTSPYLSNILMKQFDKRVSRYSVANNIRYTRYADDLTFSGDFEVSKMISFIQSILNDYSLELNKSKIRSMTRNERQEVTGITVNEKLQLNKQKRNNLRLEIYYLEKFGVKNHLKHNKVSISRNQYLKSLLGKIEYGLFINPTDRNLQSYKIKVNKMLKRM